MNTFDSTWTMAAPATTGGLTFVLAVVFAAGMWIVAARVWTQYRAEMRRRPGRMVKSVPQPPTYTPGIAAPGMARGGQTTLLPVVGGAR